MTRRSVIWLVVAIVFIAGNLAGAGMAVAGREALHAGGHVLLALLGVYVARGLIQRRGRGRSWRRERPEIAAPQELTDGLARLEQSLDAVAIEVERIGESQRFMTRLFAERSTHKDDARADS
jgi:hypothetical protein